MVRTCEYMADGSGWTPKDRKTTEVEQCHTKIHEGQKEKKLNIYLFCHDTRFRIEIRIYLFIGLISA